ncbi:methylated-DNA--[protein]-cysteine S-methyltransferase [Lacrimispora defluvii]|uniref:Methylated-DNA--protein-cysteine methyltransferase n=1 Tax=Lacrimispora defluvii TaxID=2719233 RepID=A0ABX1VR68_9FIRM|nr:methylated-DNA--[protein]-cysteine S-methyltransferase [Lacrimispora defluvii]NNJ29781.1 methylated-DNA--[protein]-cysteine S-methyltransferase [Lacrimispora defluvii]
MKCWDIFESELGPIQVICDEEGVLGVEFGIDAPKEGLKKSTDLIKKTVLQLNEYLIGERTQFDLPLKPEGTAFQKKVWEALCTIPYGQTRSYKEIAVQIGNEKACRAVGMANNRNPISIIIPCHRVIGADKSLVGYGRGLDIKVKLLNLESPGVTWKNY